MLKNKRIYMIQVVGFFILIIFTSFLLLLPISNDNNLDIMNSIFLSTSAVSGTGFTTVNLAEDLTLIGQVFLLGAIQVGGIGFMIFFALVLNIRNKKLKLSDTLILSNEINLNNKTKVKDRIYRIIQYTILIESVGVLLLSIKFIPEYGILKGIWFSLFHSISAFCNAGLDIFGSNSLIIFADSYYVNFVIIGLMLLGGFGFFVLEDIVKCIKEKKRHLQVHSKLILVTSFWLILIGTLLFKILMPEITIIQALFNTISSRSTGFSTMNIATLNNPSKLLFILLMFIGGAAGSCTGGIRLVNFVILILLPISVIRDEDIVVFYRRIDISLVKRAITVFLVYVFLTIIGFMLLLITEQLPPMDMLFELISAISTTGLATINILDFSMLGKIIIVFYMYLGRLGPITFITLFSFNSKKSKDITYASADLMI